MYKSAGVAVVGVGEERAGTWVRAILQGDGTGSVEMAASPPLMNDPEEMQAMFHAVESFLIGTRREQSPHTVHLVQHCVKFWLANSSGELVVYPSDLACIQVLNLIQSASCRDLKKSSESLAFFLPRVSLGTVTNAHRIRFGSGPARGVFLGGGPFVLKDSADLVETALRRLGYVDDALNSDLNEGMFCFLNNSNNKHALRKLAMLPSPGDSSHLVQQALRAAFLSNGSPGHWRVPHRGPRPFLLDALRSEGLISPKTSESCSPEEIFEAMKVYAQRHGLPPMRTFNGLSRRIQNQVVRDPTMRSLIEFGR